MKRYWNDRLFWRGAFNALSISTLYILEMTMAKVFQVMLFIEFASFYGPQWWAM